MTDSNDVLARAGVVRVSRGNFDPGRFDEVERVAREMGVYLIPAIRQLPGLVAYSAGASSSGSMVHVSLWDTELHAQQMAGLRQMIVDARQAAEAVGVQFGPIVNYPITWCI